MSEHGFSLQNRVRKYNQSSRVICSDRAKVRHDRRLHIEKKLKGMAYTIHRHVYEPRFLMNLSHKNIYAVNIFM